MRAVRRCIYYFVMPRNFQSTRNIMKLDDNLEQVIKDWRNRANQWEKDAERIRVYGDDEREMAAAVYRKCAAEIERALGICECFGANDYDDIVERRARLDSAMAKLRQMPSGSQTAWHD